MDQRKGTPAQAGGWPPHPEEEMVHAATAYRAMGWAVVPLAPRSKTPVHAGWQRQRLESPDLARHFGPQPPARTGGASAEPGELVLPNIGILLGPASGGLVDVDCDTREAAAIAAGLLPRTGRISGRAGSPASHYWYVVDGPVKTIKFVSPLHTGDRPSEGEHAARERHPAMLVELRAGGCQTMAPPSRHPCGERLRWERIDAPGRVDAAALTRAVGRVAAGALLARHWPPQGSRDEAALALAGMLLRAGWSEDEVDRFLVNVARAAGDEEWAARAKARQTARQLAAGGPTLGGPSLAVRLSGDGPRVVARMREWLGLRIPTPGPADEVPRRTVSLPAPSLAGPTLPPDAAISTQGAQGAQGAHIREMSTLERDEPLGVTLEVGQLLADVLRSQPQPLWGGRLYLGKLSICDGDPGQGKTLVALDVAARLTTGRDMPDGSPAIKPSGVVYFTAEDDLSDTLRPRLEAAGGDPRRLLAVTTVRLPQISGEWGENLPTFRDLDIIASAIARVSARLVIFDPFMAYLDASTNAFRDQDVRGALAPLVRLAERTGAAILLIRHLNKNSAGHALYRGGGSIGIIGAARAGILVASDPDQPERSIVASTKNNLGPLPPSQAFRVVADAQGVPVVRWEGNVAHTADSLLASLTDDALPTRLAQACELLTALLAGKPQPEKAVRAAASEEGLSWATIRRAKHLLGIRSTRNSADSPPQWIWELPEGPDGAFAPLSAPSPSPDQSEPSTDDHPAA